MIAEPSELSFHILAVDALRKNGSPEWLDEFEKGNIPVSREASASLPSLLSWLIRPSWQGIS